MSNNWGAIHYDRRGVCISAFYYQAARVTCGICAAAAWLLRTGGSFSLVHKPERLSEAFCTMSARGIEPKRLRTVHSRYDAAPSLVLIEGRRGGRPGLKIEKPLILTENGEESAEFRRIYHR